ncbi:MAG: hypothetical protein M3Y09_18355 [Actinomycetota bacterium]|nr:hypothetical protein [Actinomycetota bacterium]
MAFGCAGVAPSDALDDTGFDSVIRAETDEVLSPTGKDVGTPIIAFQPPTGVASFGPLISRHGRANGRSNCQDLWIGVSGDVLIGG